MPQPPAFATAYVDGRYVRLAEAMLPIEDRGVQFADALYEVVAVLNGRFLDWPAHVVRLARNAHELAIPMPMSEAALTRIATRLVRLARARDATLYLQLSRGVARRDHVFGPGLRPSLVMSVRRFDFRQRLRQQQTGVGVITLPDNRWGRVDIKTTGLLPNVLAKQQARAAGAFEAWLLASDGTVREGGSTNAWMVKDGTLITHPTGHHILPGIARDTLMRLARQAQLPVAARPFTLAEAQSAEEALLTSTTAPLLPVVSIDGRPVGNGRPGPVARRLAALVNAELERQTGWR
jgi:D-alanine transaminase